MGCIDCSRRRQRSLLVVCILFCCWYLVASSSSSSSSQQSAAAARGDKLLQSTVRIVGGLPAGAFEFPSFVSGKFNCGANRIWKDVVLSAAHCLMAFLDSGTWRPGIDTVQVGAWTRNNVNDTTTQSSGETVLIASEYQVHPHYLELPGVEYDFLLFKIVPPVTPALQNAISPFNRNASTDPSGEDLLTVIGFGQTQEGGNASDRLLTVEVPHVPLETCQQRYKGLVQEESMFCAGDLKGGKGFCLGDSGGPIFDASGAQVGVGSWGEGCAAEGFPQVYARISGALDWLLPTLCDLTDFPEGLNCDTVPPYVLPSPQPPDAGCNDTLPCHFPGHDYRGCQNTTALGEPCLPWNSMLSTNYPPGQGIAGLENYCRNPDQNPNGPWCYIADPLAPDSSYYCNISACARPALTETQFCAGAGEDEGPPSSSVTCTAPNFTDYFGCINETVSGYPCQQWNMQFPHEHDYVPEDYPLSGIEDGAYCRNPDQDEGGPWCFTQNPLVRWEYCYIPECNNGLSSCRATGERCADSAKCCDDNLCTGMSLSTVKTCQACAGEFQSCTQPQDCCNDTGVSLKCEPLFEGTPGIDDDSKVCLRCAGKGGACDSLTACCNPEATCGKQPTTMKMMTMMMTMTMMQGGTGGMMKMRKLTTRKLKMKQGVRSTMKCSA